MKHILLDNRKYSRFSTEGMNATVLTLSDDDFDELLIHGPSYFEAVSPVSVAHLNYMRSEGVCILDPKTSKGNIEAIRFAIMRYLPIHTILVVMSDGGMDSELVSNEFEYVGDGEWVFRESEPVSVGDSIPSYGIYRLSDSAFKYLKTLPYRGVTKAGEPQKEIAGRMMSCNDGDRLELCIVPRAEYGATSKISIKGSEFTYHSHPQDAYIKKGVSVGFPSKTDYMTFINKKVMIAHYVSTIEGLYHIHSRVKTDDSDDFERVLDSSVITDKTNGMDPKEHASEMTNLGFFTVTFIPW
jgi:hypothetical protein